MLVFKSAKTFDPSADQNEQIVIDLPLTVDAMTSCPPRDATVDITVVTDREDGKSYNYNVKF